MYMYIYTTVIVCFMVFLNTLFTAYKKYKIQFSYAAPFLGNHLPNAIRSAPTYMSFRKKN